MKIFHTFKISFSDIIRFCELSDETKGCQDTSSTQRDADINWYKLTTEAIQYVLKQQTLCMN